MPNMNDKIGGADQLDIGAIITAPTKDPNWIKKCLVMGLLSLIPFAGWFNLSGWTKTIAERHLADSEDKYVLPEAGLHYMGAGWKMFLAYLPLVGGLMLFMMIGFGSAGAMLALGGRGGEQAAMGIFVLTYAALIFLSLGINVVMPAIHYLHIVDGEPMASVQFRRIWEVMRQGGTQYLLLFVAVLIAGMIGSLGVVACYFGMLVTIPFGQAMSAVAIAEYAKLINPKTAGYDVEGGTGSRSGTPFGVKL